LYSAAVNERQSGTLFSQMKFQLFSFGLLFVKEIRLPLLLITPSQPFFSAKVRKNKTKQKKT